MNLQLWISHKLKLTGSEGSSVSTGVVIAVAGVALALIIMELTLAVVIGFKHEIASKLTGFDAKVFVEPAYDPASNSLEDYIEMSPVIEQAAAGTGIAAPLSLTLKQPGILKTDNDFSGVVFVGHDSRHDTTFERSNIIDGALPDYSDKSTANEIVISQTAADALGLTVGDKVYSCFFIDGKLKTRRHSVAGIYRSDLGEYDNVVVFASLLGLQKIAGVDSLTGTRIEISDIPDESIDAASGALADALAGAYHSRRTEKYYPVSDIHQTGAIYFNWLSLLDTNVVVIFVLMLCVAAFTLVSSLFMIILDRIRTIGLLRALGLPRSGVRNIFTYMGMRLVGLGLLIGNIAAIALLFVQQKVRLVSLDPEMYYLRYVPVEFNWVGFIAINIGIVVAAWAIMIVPAMSAARVDPAKTMHFE